MSTHARAQRASWPLLALVACLSGVGSAFAQREAESLSESFRKAAERVLPAVVSIRPGAVRGPGFAYEPGDPSVGRGMMMGRSILRTGGSGMVIDAGRGLILTTASALPGVLQATVVLADGRELPSQRGVQDSQSELVVLSVDPKANLPAQVEWGESESLRMGDWLLAIGRVSGTTQSVSAGIFSGRAVGATGLMSGETPLLRHGAQVAATGGGGPLINLAGQVVGINRGPIVPGQPPDGFGHAMPAEQARRIAAELVEHGRVRRGFLGLSLGLGGPIAPGSAGELVVSGVAPSGPAAEAGFQVGDRLVSLDGRPITELDTLARAVEAAPVGQEFRIEVERGGKRVELSVRSRQRPEPGGTIMPGPIVPGPRIPDRRLRPRERPREATPGGTRRRAPLQSEGPDENPDLSAPVPPASRPVAPSASQPRPGTDGPPEIRPGSLLSPAAGSR